MRARDIVAAGNMPGLMSHHANNLAWRLGAYQQSCVEIHVLAAGHESIQTVVVDDEQVNVVSLQAACLEQRGAINTQRVFYFGVTN